MSMSVEDAARRLRVNPQRVRALIAEGRLPARRVGRSYVLEPRAVGEFALLPRRSGRPLSVRNAWGLLALLSGLDEESSLSPRSADRLRSLLRQGGEAVVRSLRHSEPRGEVHSWRVLPIDLERLANAREIVLSGLSSQSELIDIAYDPSRDGLDAYVSHDSLRKLERRLRPLARPDAPNCLLRVPVEASWILDQDVSPPAVAAADLLLHRDARVRRAGEETLKRIVDGD